MDDLYRYVYAKVTSEGYQEPMRWALNVKGEDLIISRASKLNIREKQRLLTDKVIEIRSVLPPQVFTKALQAVQDRRAPYYDLIDEFSRQRLPIGEFVEEWYRLESAERQQQQQPSPSPLQSQSISQSVQLLEQAQQKESALNIKEFPQSDAGINIEVWRLNTFTENLNGVELEMVLVPGGTFKMGSPKDIGGDSERPQHDVIVPSFYIGKYQITQAQWQAVIVKNPSYFKGDQNLPVETVSWNEAKDFCKKISQMTGKEYRLPSEAEWEYACRAGTTGDYAGELDAMGWYKQNSGDKTQTVEQKKANAFGLYVMHGNVWEWCEDVWHGNYKDAPTDGSAWLSGGDSSLRVLRGGSWYDYGRVCRSADRDGNHAGGRDDYVGFRVVISASTLIGRSRRKRFRRVCVRESRAYSGDVGDCIRK